jgi:putative DNA-invertase from lambdoid prophage Rac
VKVAIYMRVSTADQHCEVQAQELREYCARRGWEIVEEYKDEGVSAKKTGSKSKPKLMELDRAMADAKLHRFDVILVWKLDRFGRSVMHINTQIAELKAAGVRFLAVSQNLDTDASNPTSGLLLNILAAMAEFERELIIERTKSGVAHARTLGKVPGRPRRVFRRDQAAELRKAGMSYRAIAKELGVSKTVVVETLCGRHGSGKRGMIKTS